MADGRGKGLQPANRPTAVSLRKLRRETPRPRTGWLLVIVTMVYSSINHLMENFSLSSCAKWLVMPHNGVERAVLEGGPPDETTTGTEISLTTLLHVATPESSPVDTSLWVREYNFPFRSNRVAISHLRMTHPVFLHPSLYLSLQAVAGVHLRADSDLTQADRRVFHLRRLALGGAGILNGVLRPQGHLTPTPPRAIVMVPGIFADG